jgi:hypothetical protein
MPIMHWTKARISAGLGFLWLLTSAAGAARADEAADLDALWAKRDDAAASQKLEAQLQADLAAKPGEYELLWRAARWRSWMADGTQSDSAKANYSKEGWDFGERAIKANPRHVAGYYFAALNVGLYGSAIGVSKAFSQGLEKKFNTLCDTAISLDDSFEGGGPHIAKGRLFFELPWPKRDLKRSKAELQTALQRAPNNPRGLLYLAETLLKDDDAKGAKEAMDRLAAVKWTRDPAEERRVRQRAKPVAAKIDEALK